MECNKQASYLVISVRNTAINLYRKNKSRAMRQAELIEDIVSADLKENPEVQTLDRDAVEQVKDAIRRLPRRERDAMTLRYVHNLTDTQVADTLGIQAVSARALLSRGRKRLREMLAEGRD